MISPLTYYDKIKNEQHIFIYCVAGRSSSTAFQRIINSSNIVWIWGEQHGIIEEIVTLITLMKTYQASSDVRSSLAGMYKSYKDNNHIDFYPNAIGNLDTTLVVLYSSMSNLLKPWVSSVRRFGFKDIGINDIKTLWYLKEIFPKSSTIFCFRNPLTQWPSVNAADWWSYCKDVKSFLDEYYRISNIYLNFASKISVPVFIENTDLRDVNKIEYIIGYLNIPKIDTTLLTGTVGSANVSFLSEQDEKVILNSNAYKNYLTMKDMSRVFYQKLVKS
jgi:hypothetical protein